MNRLSLEKKLSENLSLVEKLRLLDDCLNKDVKNYQDIEDQVWVKGILVNLLPDILNALESQL